MRVFPNPYLRCNVCQEWVAGYEPGKGFVPCGHKTGSTSACPTWSVALGCKCSILTIPIPHGEPPPPAHVHPYDPSKSCCTDGLAEGDFANG